MTCREKFHYSALLIKTSNISMSIYKKQINTFINIYPSISTGKIFQKTIVKLCT
jgi:hypothetical protein